MVWPIGLFQTENVRNMHLEILSLFLCYIPTSKTNGDISFWGFLPLKSMYMHKICLFLFNLALEVAVELAKTLSRFPQRCMNTDRASAYYGMYDAKSINDALQREFTQGMGVMLEESIPGLSF